MRKRMMSAAFVLSMSMSLALLGGCGDQAAAGSAAVSDSTVYGIVKEVGEDSITIEEGSLKERPEGRQGKKGEHNQKPDGQPPQGQPGQGGDGGQKQEGQLPQGQPDDMSDQESSDSSSQKADGENGGQEGDQNSPDQQGGKGNHSNLDMIDLTGSEKTVAVTADTTVTSGHPGRPGGDMKEQSDSSSGQEEGKEGADPGTDAVDEISDIKEGDLISVELNENGDAKTINVMTGGQGGPGADGQGMPGGSGGSGGQSSQPDSYTAVTSYQEDTTKNDEIYKSTGTDENAVLIENGAQVTLSNPTVTRTSEDSSGGDSASFYGVGAAILNTEGTAYIKDGSIDTKAKGGAGIFSYGDKAVTYVSGTTIKTSQDTSGGIHVAGGGSLYAWDVTAETSGESSAAIRSDRGGGTMVVDGGSFTSNGSGSPAVYTTADIIVNNAELTAKGSEAVCIEGLNSLRLYDSNVTGNMPENEQNDCTWNVILYQSMSGDSEEGNSTFDMEGGSLTAKNGGMFYTTNTESTFILNHVDINYAEDNAFFLKCTGNNNARGWGSTGSNGAQCTFTGIDQEMEGDVIWDSISSLDLYLTQGSSLKGAVVDDETNAGGADGSGYCNLFISKDSSWTVTGDSTLSSLSSEGSILDDKGKTVTIQNSDGTVYVKGDSEYTITVNEYKESADLSGASSATSYSDYQVEKPEALK